ncbi:hypothetical protein [Paracoccus actinidiae]|jgi:hypothetical protein|uniref:hypothetical protein n=1 Tax=Paracoccus actinidiae TaxID=3064531 RepID=UPI0027D21C89|nr:hypothetical protein [Paracoccus sp. M09]
MTPYVQRFAGNDGITSEDFLGLVAQADDDLKFIIMLMGYAHRRGDNKLFDGLMALGHMKATTAHQESPIVVSSAGLPSMDAIAQERERVWWGRLAWQILEANDRPRWEFLTGLMQRRMAC